MKSLKGWNCVRCALKGHRCQAEMIDDGKPLCMRCANGELCCFETAKALPTPRRYEDNRDAYCVVPAFEELSVPRRKHGVRVKPPIFTKEEVAELRVDLRLAPLESVAKRHHIEPCMIEQFLPDPNEVPERSKHLLCHARFAARRRQVLRMPDGERVRVKAEPQIEKQRPCMPFKWIEQAVAERFGITTEELLSKSHNWDACRPRQVAMWVARYHFGANLMEIGSEFQRHHTSVMHALRCVENRLKSDIELQASVEAVLATLIGRRDAA